MESVNGPDAVSQAVRHQDLHILRDGLQFDFADNEFTRDLQPRSTMHGRPRKRVHDPKAVDESRKNADLVKSLLTTVLQNHHDRCYTKQGLEDNARLIELNPEVYTAWNYRKLAVKHLLEAEPEDNARRKLVKEELKVNENALKANMKSYGAWHHRKWLIGLGFSSLDHEFALLKELFKADGRNFHGWDYRRYLVRVKGVSLEKELDYTEKLINDNFSNYSAWHNRSALLSQLFQDNRSEKRKEEILNTEFEFVKPALFIDPNDQSGWFYHSWLLGHSTRDVKELWEGRLLAEISMCRELLETEEKESKWARLTLARLLMAIDGSKQHRDEILSLYDKLMGMDPAHREYYKDMLKQVNTPHVS